MKSKLPCITIITVCLNSEKTIEETILSVVNQTYTNIEYIIVDGLSQDRTLNLVKKYEKYISRIISEKDEGIYDAINKGIEIATGDIIGILNSDDQYFPNSLTTIASQYQRGIILSGYCIVSDGSPNQLMNRNGKRFQKRKSIDNLKYRMAIDHPGMFIPLDYYKTYGSYDTKYQISSDYKWTAKAWMQGANFKIIDEPLVLFSRGGASDNEWLLSSVENKSIQAELGLLSPLKSNLYFIFRISNFLKTFILKYLIEVLKIQIH